MAQIRDMLLAAILLFFFTEGTFASGECKIFSALKRKRYLRRGGVWRSSDVRKDPAFLFDFQI